MFQSRLFKSCLFLALLALIVSVAASQSDQPPQSEPDLPAVTATPTPAVADDATINLHRWGAVTLFHGLPSDRVNAIAEDAGGMLWFGTDNGLVRYDGRNVEAAPNEADLPSRRILALKFDHRGYLWIGTDAGAARLRGNRIEVMPETRGRAASGIALSQQGSQSEVTVVTGAGEIIHYREQAEGAEGGSRSISSSINISASKAPAVKLDPNTHPLLKYPKSPNQPSEALPLATITYGSSGDWLIGSSGRGLLINRENDLREASTRTPRPYFVSSIFDDGARVWLAEQAGARVGGLWIWKNGALARASFEAGPITAVHGGDGELWVGSLKKGAFLLRFENGGVKVIEHLTFENTGGGLRSNQINAIFCDREGVVWFGSDRGVCRYDRSSFRASTVSNHPQSNYVRVALHTSDGETWLGTNRGLFKLATKDATANPDRGDSDLWAEVAELEGRSIYALTENGGAIWVGSVGGLFVKSKGASSFSRIPSTTDASIMATGANAGASADAGANEAVQTAPKDTQQAETQQIAQGQQTTRQPDVSSTKEIVRAIAGFRGQIYAAFYEGRIERVDTTANGFTRASAFTDAGAKRVTCMAVERQNGADAALWYGTADGELRRFDGSRTMSFALPQKQSAADRGIRALAVTERGVWIGSAQGLYLREGDSIREIRPDVDVWSLLVTHEAAPKSEKDNAPREVVWIATKNAGLIKLLPYQGVWARFDTEQGLPSQQIFALASGENGDLWVGANRGVARHRPSQVEPRLQIKRLVAPDRIYLPEELTAEVSLPHTTRSLLLEVTGVGSKTFSSQFQYEFARLDQNGTEEKKIQSAPQFAVENLQSGSYTIVARAVSRDLVYSAPLNVRLRIRRAPPPWLPMLLATLLAVAVAAAALAFRQQFRLASANRALEKTNIELTETRLRLANETEAERSRIARDLHDQTLADLRHLLVMTDQLAGGGPSTSPPSGLSSPPSSGSEDSAPSPAALRREIEAISSEIRHICEDLSPSALENIGFLPALEWALSNAVAQLPAGEKFAYEFICEASLEDRLRLTHIERIQLYRMVQEALNNICRHARAKQVKMEVRAENLADLVIEIRDDGVGFDGSRTNKTGHGIANIRSRANLIGARAEWKNARPGCRFEIRKEGCVTEDRGSRIED